MSLLITGFLCKNTHKYNFVHVFLSKHKWSFQFYLCQTCDNFNNKNATGGDIIYITNSVHFSQIPTYSMVQSPSWEANWFAANQEIPRISRNPKVHYRTLKRPPPVSILGQPSPVHIPTSHLLEIHPNITHPSTPRSPQWSLSLRFPH